MGGHRHAVQADDANSPCAASPQRFDDERYRVELPVPLVDARPRAGFNDLPLEGEKAAEIVTEQQPHVAKQRLEVGQVAERLAMPVGAENEADVATRVAEKAACALAPSHQLVVPPLSHVGDRHASTTRMRPSLHPDPFRAGLVDACTRAKT